MDRALGDEHDVSLMAGPLFLVGDRRLPPVHVPHVEHDGVKVAETTAARVVILIRGQETVADRATKEGIVPEPAERPVLPPEERGEEQDTFVLGRILIIRDIGLFVLCAAFAAAVENSFIVQMQVFVVEMHWLRVGRRSSIGGIGEIIDIGAQIEDEDPCGQDQGQEIVLPVGQVMRTARLGRLLHSSSSLLL